MIHNHLIKSIFLTFGIDASLEGQVGERTVPLAQDEVRLHLDLILEEVALFTSVRDVAAERYLEVIL